MANFSGNLTYQGLLLPDGLREMHLFISHIGLQGLVHDDKGQS